MKKTILFFVLILVLPNVSIFAQTGMQQLPYIETINKAGTENITIEGLDKYYQNAVNVDSTKAVFKSQVATKKLIGAYTDFLQGLGDYLKQHGYKWGQPTRVWNRIYFNTDGAVEYYLFDFKTQTDDEKIQQYKELFREYIKTHKIGMSAPVKFSQCSPIIFKD